MSAKIETAFSDFISTLQIAKLYTTEHAIFRRYLDRAFDSLNEVLQWQTELVIGIIGEELAYEKEIFFDLSKRLHATIVYLKERQIERMSFYRGMEKKELGSFIGFLCLKKDEVKNSPANYFKMIGIRNITIGRLQAVAPAGGIGAGGGGVLVDSDTVYTEAVGTVTKATEALLNRETIDLLTLRFSLQNILENLIGSYQEFLKLTSVKRYDATTFMHMLHVAILSMYVCAKLGFEHDDILDIGVAALFHDIGKLYVSRQLISKAGKLTDEEFDKIRSHVVVGSEILLNYVNSLGMLPVIVSFEHHLKFDLRGYPKLSFFQSQHLASQVVSLCDVYDALFARRSYKSDYPPDVIHEIMSKERGKGFDPDLFDEFFKIMGVWPVGTIVRLSDGRVAVVRSENEDDIRVPVVQVIHPRKEDDSINLKDTKGSLSISAFLNPLTEGKEFLALI